MLPAWRSLTGSLLRRLLLNEGDSYITVTYVLVAALHCMVSLLARAAIILAIYGAVLPISRPVSECAYCRWLLSMRTEPDNAR